MYLSCPCFPSFLSRLVLNVIKRQKRKTSYCCHFVLCFIGITYLFLRANSRSFLRRWRLCSCFFLLPPPLNFKGGKPTCPQIFILARSVPPPPPPDIGKPWKKRRNFFSSFISKHACTRGGIVKCAYKSRKRGWDIKWSRVVVVPYVDEVARQCYFLSACFGEERSHQARNAKKSNVVMF